MVSKCGDPTEASTGLLDRIPSRALVVMAVPVPFPFVACVAWWHFGINLGRFFLGT